MTSCTCKACRENGTPFPGLSVHPTMHVVGEEMGHALARVEAPKVIVRSRPQNSLVTFSNEQVVDMLAHVIAGIHEAVDRKYAARIKALEARLEDSNYRGVWQSSQLYRRGHYVTVDGSMFHCNRDDTQSRPGTDHDWQLCVRAGRNGHDLRDESSPRVPTRSRRQS